MTATAESASTTSATAPAARPRALAWFYVVGGVVGLVSSFALVLEKLAKLNNPGYIPSCSLNPIISCGSVMDSTQAGLFGFPNPLIGVAAFPVVVVAGAVLLAGFDAPRWFWAWMQVAVTVAVIFIHWLIFASLYQIHALCPYCMVVWVITIAMFWYTTLHNLNRSKQVGAGGQPAVGGIARFHSLVLTVWYLVIVGLILQAFWSYWITLL